METFHAQANCGDHPLAAQVTAFEVKLVGLQILRRGFDARPESDLELFGNGARNLILDGEDILHLPVVAVGPQLEAVSGVHQLGGDADPIAGAPNAAVKNVDNAKFGGNLADLRVLALKRERRTPRGHTQAVNLTQRDQNFFGQSVAEILVLLIRAQIDEGQHGDGSGFWLVGRGLGYLRERLLQQTHARKTRARVFCHAVGNHRVDR